MESGSLGAFITGALQPIVFVLVAWGIYALVKASRSGNLHQFTMRTQPKVNTQWNLYCLVHNIEKLSHHGYVE